MFTGIFTKSQRIADHPPLRTHTRTWGSTEGNTTDSTDAQHEITQP